MKAEKRGLLGGPALLTAICASAAALIGITGGDAQSSDANGAVTVNTFVRAESDLNFGAVAVKEGGFGKFAHHRDLTPVAFQTVVRQNRDTLYSAAVFDLDAGPVTITVPEPGARFLSVQVFDQDEYTVFVAYGAGEHGLIRSHVGTRYALCGIRILVEPANPKDVAAVRALQDAVRVQQQSAGRFEPPTWDEAVQKKLRESLLVLGATLPDSKRMFGREGQVEPVRHLIGAAMAWGGNPEKEATYLNVTPRLNDGKTVYRLTVKDVPVDGFWSISVYDRDGYFEPNARNVYSLNNLTAAKNADGSIDIQFGGDASKTPNTIPIVKGWNYLVRLYRPRPEILSGHWTFPEAQPVH
jgi:hypothetical protein